MAARYYGVPLGGDMKTDVTEAASTTSAAFEFVIANTTLTGSSKMAALKALEAIRQKLSEETWPVG